MVVHAVYENGVFRPTEPIELPDNCQVSLVIHKETTNPDQQELGETPLAKLAALGRAHAKNPNLPTDLAAQHDHYLYGTPKH